MRKSNFKPGTGFQEMVRQTAENDKTRQQARALQTQSCGCNVQEPCFKHSPWAGEDIQEEE